MLKKKNEQSYVHFTPLFSVFKIFSKLLVVAPQMIIKMRGVKCPMFNQLWADSTLIMRKTVNSLHNHQLPDLWSLSNYVVSTSLYGDCLVLRSLYPLHSEKGIIQFPRRIITNYRGGFYE